MSNNETEKSLSNTRINWYPGHKAKEKKLMREKH